MEIFKSIHGFYNSQRRHSALGAAIWLDEHTREALSIADRSKMSVNEVRDALHPLLMKNGKPEFNSSDNGPELIAAHLQDWLRKFCFKLMQIHPVSPWEYGYNECFNRTLRGSCQR